MALDFPGSPTNGQTHTENGLTYTYDSTYGVWKVNPIAVPDVFGVANSGYAVANAAFNAANNVNLAPPFNVANAAFDKANSGLVAQTWTTYTSSSTYTVPLGRTTIRAYAVGRGGDGSSANSGGGGGCAYGDISVVAGDTVYCNIAANGQATVTYGGETYLTANAGSTPTGGGAAKSASVTNGGAYSGGNGGRNNTGGASAGSPLGNGVNAIGGQRGGCGIGGAGGSTGGGGAGGAGGAEGGGGSGGPGTGAVGGPPRSQFSAFTDPLLAGALYAGGSASYNSSTMLGYPPAGPGGGGVGYLPGGYTGFAISTGADFGGGGGTSTTGQSGRGGGLMGGGGSGPAGGGAGGFGGGGGSAPTSAGAGGGAIILIYG